jgi:hypothetical protein
MALEIISWWIGTCKSIRGYPGYLELPNRKDESISQNIAYLYI